MSIAMSKPLGIERLMMIRFCLVAFLIDVRVLPTIDVRKSNMYLPPSKMFDDSPTLTILKGHGVSTCQKADVEPLQEWSFAERRSISFDGILCLRGGSWRRGQSSRNSARRAVQAEQRKTDKEMESR
jgi:hypothetical protein